MVLWWPVDMHKAADGNALLTWRSQCAALRLLDTTSFAVSDSYLLSLLPPSPFMTLQDVMTGASAVVRKIHASVPGIIIEEDDRYVKMIAQPSFLPKGIPAAHVETYDKTHATAPTWMPRRDVRLVG